MAKCVDPKTAVKTKAFLYLAGLNYCILK